MITFMCVTTQVLIVNLLEGMLVELNYLKFSTTNPPRPAASRSASLQLVIGDCSLEIRTLTKRLLSTCLLESLVKRF